jgi:hypothetical protein
MTLQLLIGDGGHWFFDTDLGVQVGAAYQQLDGSWDIEVNGDALSVPDLETAKRAFVQAYDPRKVQVSPLSDDGELDYAGFEVITLPSTPSK